MSVALDPEGRADSVRVLPGAGKDEGEEGEGRKVFTLPYETEMAFGEAIAWLARQAGRDDPNNTATGDGITLSSFSSSSREPILYIQPQNNSFPTEYAPLVSDIDMDIPWASEALGRSPEAVNIWIGTHQSRTSLHKGMHRYICLCVCGGSRVPT